MSPLMHAPLLRTFSLPCSSIYKMAFLIYSWPWTFGAKGLLKWSKIPYLRNSKHLHCTLPTLNAISLSISQYQCNLYLTLVWVLQNFLIFATSSVENVDVISLLISLILLGSIIVLSIFLQMQRNVMRLTVK